MNDLCIIIPAYNSKKTIDITLESIKNQKISIKFEVMIVNDCSDYDYKEFVDKYKNYYSIREIKTKRNSGPGVSRQLGIDNTSSKYIIFIDSDDSFYDADSIEKLYQEIVSDDYDLIIGNFIYKRDGLKIKKKKDLIWLHGKIYKRDFLEKNRIKFNNTRANEDNGFNRLILFMKPKYKFLDKFVYVYNENPNSITRKNNRLYKFIGIEGFSYNMSWAIEQAVLRGISKEKFAIFSLDVLGTLYMYYLNFEKEYDVNEIIKWGRKIKQIYDLNKEKINQDLIDKMLDQKVIQFMSEFVIKDYNITFEEFLNKFDN